MYRLFVFLFLPFVLSCSSYNKLLKSDDPEKKYEAAMAFYEAGDYYRTLQLLDNVIPSYRGTVKAEHIYYYYAYSHYHQKDYLTAAFHFNNLAKTLPNSQYAEEALYMGAYSKFLHSPDYFLDQTNTRQAIQEMQLFINKYPKSERVAEANKMIDQMREKLELKAFENAQLFLKIENYMSAIVALQNVIKDYPGTQYTEESMFLIVKAAYLYAQGSVQQRQQERYENVKTHFEAFQSQFPNSRFMSEAQLYFNNSVRNIEKILSENKE